MSADIAKTTGTPRITSTKSTSARLIRLLPPGMLILAAVLILISMLYPYWRMELQAPQYPGGLEMRVFVNRMTGDEDPVMDEVKEIDGLNHYIGMKSLYNAAKVERVIAIPALILTVLLLIGSAIWRSPWSWLLVIPAMGFPFVFLADLAFWLNHYGQNLDPNAPLSSAIKPFTPPVLGEGVIGNFVTTAYLGTGWFVAVGAVAMIVAAMIIELIILRSSSDAAAA